MAPVLSLALTDTLMILIEDVILAVAIIITVLIIALSYIRIATMILKITSAEGQQKAFCIYAGHLTVFLIFFSSVSLMYLHFSSTYSPILDTAIALVFTLLPPIFNPIIYSLRKRTLRMQLENSSIFKEC